MDLQDGKPKPNGFNNIHKEKERETTLVSGHDDETNNGVEEKLILDDEKDTCKVAFEVEKPKAMIYGVRDNPPVHLAFMFGFQQTIVNLSSPISIVLFVSEVACSQDDLELKVILLSATMFMTGLSTFMMTTFGVRLPIFQGPASAYLIPLIAMQSLPEWKCPATYNVIDPISNRTTVMASIINGTDIPNREISLGVLSQISGSLMAAGAIHCVIGMTGLVGFFIRYIGPITIVPTIALMGLKLYVVIVKFAQTDWSVAAFVAGMNLIMSLYLARCKTPIPMWNSQRGFHIFWYPLHQVFSILLSMTFGWALAAILTYANFYSSDPRDKHFTARTDARTQIISDTKWFLFPYPGQFGPISFNAGAFLNFFVATLMSILDSIGDYAACARISRVTPPPGFAFNRGLAVEGLMSTLSGAMGVGHATVSYGGNIGAISITKVASRTVFQMVGFYFILFACIGKLGAVFTTIPYSVLGGLMIITIGIFLGMLLSYLQTIDLNSTRNLAIIGITLILGFAIPYYIQKNPNDINTGNSEVDSVIRMILSNPAFIGGFVSCFLDNTVPGTLKERGLLDQMKDLNDEEAKEFAKSFENGPEVYRLPHIPAALRRSILARIFPIFDSVVNPAKINSMS